jgi:TolB-like protein/DNA-binding winged helix-turn-helix (wHTH) protein/Flp pilus assembly protein TadD
MSRLTSTLYEFGEFRVDTQNRLLLKGDAPVAITPKAFEVLLALIQQSGEIVGKDTLLQTVWPNSFVEESNLTQTVFMLRKALGETSAQRYILTVQGQGYRFVPEVKAIAAKKGSANTVVPIPPSSEATQANSSVTHVPATTSNSRVAVTTAVFALLIIGTIVWFVRSSRTASASLPMRSIAVLPLDNLSGDPAQDYFADAMTDELITHLAQLGSLRVTSRTTVALYKHTNKKLPEIARELNVDGIVEGSVVRDGQRIRVTAQLIKASTDQHLWADTYDRDLGDALALQSDIASAIAKQVQAQMATGRQAQLHPARPVNPQAYDAYLKGSFYLYNNSLQDAAMLNQAKTSFEEAIRLDPNFSSAYSGLANSYIYLVFNGAYGKGQKSAAEGYQRAVEADQKALQLEPNNAEAHEVLGVLRWHVDLDWDAADRAFMHSLALSPSYSCAHEDRALFLAFRGRSKEALDELEKSIQVDPMATGLAPLVYFQLRDWNHLVEYGIREVASNPKDWGMHDYLGAGFEGLGKLPEAIAEYQKAVDLSNGNPEAKAYLGHAYAVIGNRVQAEKILRELEQKSKSGVTSPYLAATVYAGLGNKEKAFELLEQASREKSLDVAWIVKPDLRTDNLRSDPRFADLLRRNHLN